MDQQNYAHYGAFQHVNLQSLRREDEDWFNELNEKRFAASLTGYVFSTIHNDLTTELFNKETKGTFGPFRCGFSNNIDSKHRKLTKSGKELHLLHLKSLKVKLSGYGVDLFTLGYPINLSSGEKIDKNVYNDTCQVEI